jgi:hypothetical protein
MTPFLFFVEPTEAEFGPIRFEFATKFTMFTKFTLAASRNVLDEHDKRCELS